MTGNVISVYLFSQVFCFYRAETMQEDPEVRIPCICTDQQLCRKPVLTARASVSFLVVHILIRRVGGTVQKKNVNCLFTHEAHRSSYELVETCPCVPDRIGIWKCWFLRRGENRSTRRKTSRSKGENQQQGSTHMWCRRRDSDPVPFFFSPYP